jgi:hypothetical protein
MKKAKLFLLAFVAIFSVVMTSCNPEENNPPTISITGIADNGTYTLGSVPQLVAVIGANDAELKTLAIDVTGSGLLAPVLSNLTTSPASSFETTPTVSPFEFANNIQNVTVNYTMAISQAGSFTVRLIATDKNDESVEVTLSFTVTTAAGQIVSYNDVLLGSHNNATLGSSFASIDGIAYGLADAKANSSKIDFVYFYGATNQATIAAPNEVILDQVFTTASAPSTWTVKNATKMKKSSLTAAQFDAVANDAAIIADATGLTASYVNTLAVGDVITFETASTSANASKKGMLKITQITGTDAGTIKFSVKVQD